MTFHNPTYIKILIVFFYDCYRSVLHFFGIPVVIILTYVI